MIYPIAKVIKPEGQTGSSSVISYDTEKKEFVLSIYDGRTEIRGQDAIIAFLLMEMEALDNNLKYLSNRGYKVVPAWGLVAK